MPFSSKFLIRKIYCTEKNAKNTHSVSSSFSDKTAFEAFQSVVYFFLEQIAVGHFFLGHLVQYSNSPSFAIQR